MLAERAWRLGSGEIGDEDLAVVADAHEPAAVGGKTDGAGARAVALHFLIRVGGAARKDAPIGVAGDERGGAGGFIERERESRAGGGLRVAPDDAAFRIEPLDGEGAERADGEASAIGGKAQRAHGEAAEVDGLAGFAGDEIPQPDGAVFAARGEPATGGIERADVDKAGVRVATGVAHARGLFEELAQIPALHGVVVAAGGEPRAVGRDGDGHHHVAVGHAHMRRERLGDVADGVVEGVQRKLARAGLAALDVLGERVRERAEFPNRHRAIVAAGDEHPVGSARVLRGVACESQRPHRVVVRGEADARRRFEIPQLDDAAAKSATDREHFSIGRKRERIHAAVARRRQMMLRLEAEVRPRFVFGEDDGRFPEQPREVTLDVQLPHGDGMIRVAHGGARAVGRNRDAAEVRDAIEDGALF